MLNKQYIPIADFIVTDKLEKLGLFLGVRSKDRSWEDLWLPALVGMLGEAPGDWLPLKVGDGSHEGGKGRPSPSGSTASQSELRGSGGPFADGGWEPAIVFAPQRLRTMVALRQPIVSSETGSNSHWR